MSLSMTILLGCRKVAKRKKKTASSATSLRYANDVWDPFWLAQSWGLADGEGERDSIQFKAVGAPVLETDGTRQIVFASAYARYSALSLLLVPGKRKKAALKDKISS